MIDSHKLVKKNKNSEKTWNLLKELNTAQKRICQQQMKMALLLKKIAETLLLQQKSINQLSRGLKKKKPHQ